MSWKFWRQVASIDLDHLQARMQGQGQGTPPVSLDRFAEHFDKIAQPPMCEWFDHALMQQMKAVVKVTLQDTEGSQPQQANVDSDQLNGTDYVLPEDASDLLHRPISLADLYEGKERMKRGKASGLDGIPIERVLGVRGTDPEMENESVSPID